MNRLVILNFIILLTIGSSCKKNKVESSVVASTSDVITMSRDQQAAVGITLGKIVRERVSLRVRATGKLDVPPQNLVTIAAPMGGFVVSTSLLQGMKVKKGQVVATLKHQDYIQLQQDYLNNLSQLEFLENDYKRQLELSKDNINAQKTLQQAKSTYASMQAIVQGLEAKLKMINIAPTSLRDQGIRSTINLYSPIDGYVTDVRINVGKYVDAASELVTIVDMQHVHVELAVYEKDINRLHPGQRVQFYLVNDTTMHKAFIHLIGKEISADRTVRVHCHLEQEDERLMPGMFVTADIEADAQKVDVLPTSAIANYQGEYYIFIADSDTTFRPVMIKTGVEVNGKTRVEIADTIRNRDVVITGTFQLLGLFKNTDEE